MIALNGFDQMPHGDSEAKSDLKKYTKEELAGFLEERFGMTVGELIEKAENDPVLAKQMEDAVSKEFGPIDSEEAA
jgi:hypothetical protein